MSECEHFERYVLPPTIGAGILYIGLSLCVCMCVRCHSRDFLYLRCDCEHKESVTRDSLLQLIFLSSNDSLLLTRTLSKTNTSRYALLKLNTLFKLNTSRDTLSSNSTPTRDTPLQTQHSYALFKLNTSRDTLSSNSTLHAIRSLQTQHSHAIRSSNSTLTDVIRSLQTQHFTRYALFKLNTSRDTLSSNSTPTLDTLS